VRSRRLLPIAAWCFVRLGKCRISDYCDDIIFATYFTSKIAENAIVGTYQWANATAIAGLMIAVMSPIVGAIADNGGYHKRWLLFFTGICIISSALLWFAYPESEAVYFTLACVIVGTIGLETGIVFYNSFLPTLVSRNYIGRVSGWGWGCGYLGGIVALSIALFCFLKTDFAWLAIESRQIRICGPLVAIWFLLFSLPFFFPRPEYQYTKATFEISGCQRVS